MSLPQAHRQIAADRAARIAQHQMEFASALANGVLGQPNSPLNLLADGDSWFCYPLDDQGRWGTYFDVIAQLQILPSNPMILNFSHYGDATTTEMGYTRVERIIDAVNDQANGPFDAILFSGGGDDIVGDQFCIWLNDAIKVGNDPQKALNSAFGLILDIIKTSYSQLVELRNSLNRLGAKVPIFVHGYDFALPTGVGVCGLGPWLRPSLEYRGWMDPTKPNQGAGIVKDALTQFANMLQTQFANDNVIYVPTQGTLAANEWANELHPRTAGFAKIAAKFQTALANQFPGRI